MSDTIDVQSDQFMTLLSDALRMCIAFKSRLPTTPSARLRVGQVNRMIGDLYELLGDPAKHITEHNITTWVPGGYKDWLSEYHRLEETRVKQEVAMDLACPDAPPLTATRPRPCVRRSTDRASSSAGS